MKYSAVIGAGYGDEGKGLITDYLAAQSPNALVVRFNGGSQAGHTVERPSGLRHVFSHFGSGSLVGSRTFLSRFFICNPITFMSEWNTLREKTGLELRPFVSRMCPVTTPYDIMLNRALEKKRYKRHGSCGLGINETVERMNNGPKLYFQNLYSRISISVILDQIRTEYVPRRMEQLELTPRMMEFLNDDSVKARYLDEAQRMFNRCDVTDWKRELIGNQDVIFEGAQGLMLDEDHDNFPYVTRSKTGLQNVTTLMKELGIDKELNAYYVTRTYATRHGEGPLADEYSGHPPGMKIHDPTNVKNDWQGLLRFGLLDASAMARLMKKDVNRYMCETGNSIWPRLALTCIDQLGDDKLIKTSEDGELSVKGFVDMMSARMNSNMAGLYSYGPNRESIRERL